MGDLADGADPSVFTSKVLHDADDDFSIRISMDIGIIAD